MAFEPFSLISDILPEISALLVNDQAPKYSNKLSEMNMQMANQFEFFINRKIKPLEPSNTFSGGGALATAGNYAIGSVGTLASAAFNYFDIEVSQLYVQDITVPDVKIEYENINGYKAAANLLFPETTTITFLEDDKGTVMRYLTEWKRNVVIPATSSREPNAYIFRDDQDMAKRNGLLLLKTHKDTQKYPRIIFNGLKIAGIGDFTIGHGEEGNLTYSVDFAIDDVKIPLIF